MATTRKRNGKYQVQVRREGSQSISKTFLKLDDAKTWARLMEVEADQIGLPVDPKILAKTKVRTILERYRDEVIVKKRGREIETLIIKAILRQSWCDRSLAQIDSATFSKYRDMRLQTVKPCTVKRELGILQHAFDIAVREWSVPLRANPLKPIAKPMVSNRRDRRLREGELDQLLKAAGKTRNPFLLPIVRFALETGMRRGEILALRFRDVDIECCMAIIRMSKNGHARTIPLSTLAVAILETSIAVMDDEAKASNEHIFPITALALRLAWDRLTKRAKIDDLHFHDLRHEAISRFFEKGLTVPEVASISGHRDIRMLLRYAHADKGKLAEKLNG
ncbi:site-specific integrase [Brucella anthropi]|uniref:site-specific integrase n=1 Tax=Brucella anthropi TaxID=529 RepID=UPI00320835B2